MMQNATEEHDENNKKIALRLLSADFELLTTRYNVDALYRLVPDLRRSNYWRAGHEHVTRNLQTFT